MICLTGDIHHMSMKTLDQRYANITEAEAALKYLQIAKGYDLRVTLFITGKTFLEEPETIKKMLAFKNLEIGGHTYGGLRPKLLHKVFAKLTGSEYGPKLFQKIDIKKTLDIIEKETRKKCFSWRTHQFQSNSNTFIILKNSGVKTVSDAVSPSKKNPWKENGLRVIPINTLRDHGHIYHGFRTQEQVNQAKSPGDPFDRKSYPPAQWLEIVKSQVQNLEGEKGVATLLVHPICMKIADNFKTFKKLCKFLSNYESLTVSKIPWQKY